MKNIFERKSLVLEITVFVCGAGVMVFELLGSRILAPYIGTSTYAWTSLIGVILASLSLGYYYGGRLSDKRPEIRILAFVIGIASLCIFITTLVKDVVSSISLLLPFSIEIKSLLLSLILFAPASFFLGIVSPFAVKLRMLDMEKTGSVAGNLYALSTAGSIVGTFTAGFFIVPYFGLTTSLYTLSFVLFLMAGLLYANLFRKAGIAFIFIILFFSVLLKGDARDLFPFVIADIDTEYNRIWVYKGVDKKTDRPTLNLSMDPFGTQASIFTDEKGKDDLVFDSMKFYRLAGFFSPNAKTALMLGGCVYVYPRDFLQSFPSAVVDVVEIDPGMTEAAKKYFGFKDDPRMDIYHEDARTFLNENKKLYDLVFIDAFNSALSIPFHLTTIESTKLVYDSLNDEGIVLVNIISSISGDKGRFFRAEYETYKKVFPQVYVFPVEDVNSPNKIQNIIMVAFKSNLKPSFSSDKEEFRSYLSHLWKGEISADMPVLTDDFAPVEHYRRQAI